MARKKTPAPAAAPPPILASPPMAATKPLLALLVAVYLLLGLGYSALTPPPISGQHNPDEAAHLEYVATLASGHLPVFKNAAHGYENHQPPLYYALCAPVSLAAHGYGTAVTTRMLRCVSLLLGVLLILAAYRCVRTLFPADRWFALGTSACVALLPGNVALSASVSNDALTNLVMALGLWQIARLAAERDGWDRKALGLGLILGAGLWTKTSTLLLFPVAFFVFYALARREPTLAPASARAGALALGLGALLGAPWLIRNQLLYGDPLAQHIFQSAFSQTAQADVITRFLFGGSVFAYLGGVAVWTFASFWGGFDSGLIFWGQNPHARLDPAAPGAYGIYGGLPPPFYALPLLLCLLALVGLFRRRRAAPLVPAQSVLLGAFALLIALNGVVFLRFILTFFQAQGRYWYPSLVPLAFFLVWGLSGLLGPRRLPLFVGLLTLSLVALNLYTLFGLLLPRFG